MNANVGSYLALLDSQREAIFERLERVPAERIWTRPESGKWSAGEQLDHTRVLNRSFRRMLRIAWPILRPIARLRRGRAYDVTIDNVYLRPNMPTKVGVLWPPHHSRERPAPLAALREALGAEHLRIRHWFEGQDEHLLGNAYVWDPPIGWLNLIQGLRVIAYHDEHHYTAVRRILGI